jgi:uroporphyrinogen-III synthase
VKTNIVSEFIKAVERGDFDCLFFTSALPATIIAPQLNRFPRVIAIGPETAKALRRFEIECETLPGFYSRDFVPYLGSWIAGKHIGIPRADVQNAALIDAIAAAGGIPHEFRCYTLEPTGKALFLQGADALLFTSAMSFAQAIWTPRPDLLIMAIGTVTAGAMQRSGVPPAVVGDGSLEGSLVALNNHIRAQGSPVQR